MTMCTCLVQAGQIAPETQSALREKLDGFAKSKFGSAAQIRWVEIDEGSGYTANKPSTSSLVSLTADKPVEQGTRIGMLHELCELWAGETGCTLDEIVGVISDPTPA